MQLGFIAKKLTQVFAIAFVILTSVYTLGANGRQMRQ